MIRTMTRGLVQAGLDVHVATTDDNGPDHLQVILGAEVEEEGVSYWYFPRQIRFYTFSWPLTCWLAEHVREYDVVHIHALFSYAAVPAAYYARRYKIPYIVRPLGVLNRWGMQNRHSWLKKVSFPFIEQQIIRGASVMHYTSEQECLEAAEIGVRQRHVIIPNATDIPRNVEHIPTGTFRAMHPELADRLIILFLSRVDPKKGLDLLLPAFAKVYAKFARAVLVIAGDGEHEFQLQLQREAARLGITAQIYWTGFLDGETKWAALRDADLYVLPSYSENFGISVVEAMACKVPVVVSNQVAIHREISAARAGIALPCKVEDIAMAILQLLSDHQRRMNMGIEGRKMVEKYFMPVSVLTALRKLYNEIAEYPIQVREVYRDS